MKKQIKLVMAVFAIMLAGVTSAFAADYVEGIDFKARLGVYTRNGTISKDGSYCLRFYEDSEGYVCLESIRYRNGEWENQDNTYHTLEWYGENMRAKLKEGWVYIKVKDVKMNLDEDLRRILGDSYSFDPEVYFKGPGDDEWIKRRCAGEVYCDWH